MRDIYGGESKPNPPIGQSSRRSPVSITLTLPPELADWVEANGPLLAAVLTEAARAVRHRRQFSAEVEERAAVEREERRRRHRFIAVQGYRAWRRLDPAPKTPADRRAALAALARRFGTEAVYFRVLLSKRRKVVQLYLRRRRELLAARMYRRGFRNAAIARAIGCNHNTARRYWKAGMPRLVPGSSP